MDGSYKKFSAWMFLSAVTVLALAAMINVLVDPGNIYIRHYLVKRNVDQYIDKLIQSKTGLDDTVNERVLKLGLAGRAGEFDCAILGSSRVMQIGTQRKPSVLDGLCTSSINLGVSGGSLEDIIVLSDAILRAPKEPKLVLIGVDPWTLKFNMDGRYVIYRDNLVRAAKGMGISKWVRAESGWDKLAKNLFNSEYLLLSIKRLLEEGPGVLTPRNPFRNIVSLKELDYNIGRAKPTVLADGTLLYAKHILAQTAPQLPPKMTGYKIGGDAYHDNAVLVFEMLLDRFKNKGVQVGILLTPYHHNVFQESQGRAAQQMQAVTDKVRDIGRRHGVPVYGSYNPRDLGCGPDAFYDFMHPRPECLRRMILSAN